MHDIIIWEGSEKVGKTTIAESFCRLNPSHSYFKNKNEHSLFEDKDSFWLTTFYDQSYFMQFLEQTSKRNPLSICMDRAYPSEWVYSQVFNRKTDFDFLRKVDDFYNKLNAKIIICYSKIIREADEIIDSDKFDEIMKMYIKFSQWTNCEVFFLDTTEPTPIDHAVSVNKFLELSKLRKKIKNCTDCVKMTQSNLEVLGQDAHPILPNGMGFENVIVGIAPGRGGRLIKNGGTKDKPFAYFSGTILDDVLSTLKIKKKSWVTNVVKCCTPSDGIFIDDDVKKCTTNFLKEEIEIINPKRIILLGKKAEDWFKTYFDMTDNVYTLWHPSYVLRNTGNNWKDKEIYLDYVDRWKRVLES